MAKLAPEIAAKLGPLQVNPELPPAEERLRLFDHTARFIARVAADRGALLFIDDLHWADQGTLSLLHYLMRQLRNDRVLVLAAYREVELDRRHPLAKALVEWNRERLATRLALARLSHADTAALLGALFGTKTVSGEFVDVVYRETEGNPFFIEEAVKSLVEQGHVYRDGEAWARKEIHELALPQSVKEAIGRRLDRLADETVDALRTAAALGKRFSFRELAAASPGDEDTLLDALDHAVAAQLVRADGSSSKGDDVFAFTHDKIREVLNEEANPIRRRRLHQRIGEALERLYGVDAGAAAGDDEHAHDLAHHFMQAGDLVRSLGYARRAARNATRVFAHDEALAFLGQAREAAEALKQADTLVDLDEAMGDVHNERGTMLHAVECYRRSIAGTDDRARRAAQKSKIGVSYCTIGDQRGLPYLDEALAELDPQTQTSELALATALMGRYYHYRTEHRRAIALLERAHALAAPRADLLTMTLIQSYLAGAHQHLLEFEASDRWARATCELGERTGFSQAKASGWEFLGENANNRGIWIDGLAYATKDYEEGVRTGNLSRVGWGQFGVAQALYGKGELLRARKTAEDAFALAERIGEVRLASWLGPVLACACADLGDDEAAAEAAERNLPRARELGQMLLTAWALHAQGYAAMMRGDADKSVEWYAQYLPLVADTENGVARLIILPACAEAHARSGRLDEGEAIARRAIEVADVARAPHQKAVALRVIARVRAARGDVEGAREICGRALTLLDQVGGQLQWARTLALRGGWTGDRADVARAREVFEASAARDLSELR
jgi:tetratricopeptide (TPR) repeat protein